MANKTTTVEIGDRTFYFGTIPPIEAIHVEVAIVKVIGEPLFKAMMDANKTGFTEKLMEAAASLAISTLLARLDPEDLTRTMGIVFKYTTFKTTLDSATPARVDTNSTFMGRNKEIWLAFIHGLRANFSDFLPDGPSISSSKDGTTLS